MIKMNDNIITVYDKNNNQKQYKILLVIEKDYYYIIFTNLNNYNIKENLYAVKLKCLNDTSPLLINDNEWLILEQEYLNLIK